MDRFALKILKCDEKIYDGMCSSLIVPTDTGLFGVLAHHANTIMAVAPGELRYREEQNSPLITIVVTAGVLKIEDNDVSVLVLSAERLEEIDRKRAEEDAKEARAALKSKQSANEYRASVAKLSRALNRIQASEKYDGSDKS